MKKFIAITLMFLLCTACTAQPGGEVGTTTTAEEMTTAPDATAKATTEETTTEEATSKLEKVSGKLALSSKYNRMLVGKYSEKETIYTGGNPFVASGGYEHSSGFDIRYPQFFGFADKAKQNKLNEQIYQDAFKFYLLDGKIDMEYVSFAKTNYELKLKTPDLVSIFYSGEQGAYMGRQGAVIQCVNIDVNTAKILKLSDFVAIDDALVSRIVAAKKVFSSDESMTQKEIMDELYSFATRNRRSMFVALQADETVNFYLTPDAIGIIMQFSNKYIWVELETA